MLKKFKRPVLRVGDVVKHEGERTRYIVSGTKGWIHKDGAISLRSSWGGLEFLTRRDRCHLVMKREDVKEWWKIIKEDK